MPVVSVFVRTMDQGSAEKKKYTVDSEKKVKQLVEQVANGQGL